MVLRPVVFYGDYSATLVQYTFTCAVLREKKCTLWIISYTFRQICSIIKVIPGKRKGWSEK